MMTLFANVGGNLKAWVGRLVILSGLCLALGLLVGCEDVQLNWEVQQPKPRPAGPPVGRTAAQIPPQSNGGSTQGKSSTELQSAAPPLVCLYQLVLLSEPGPAQAPAGIKHIRLNNARARDVANVLMMCYVPSGPSGTDQRYTLVYPTPFEQELAAKASTLLDVPGKVSEPATDTSASNIWHYCVSEEFALLNQPHSTPSQAKRVAGLFLRITASAETARTQRWMATMIAGDILSNHTYDYPAADRAFEQAQSIAEPGSYEQLAAMYARSRAYVQDGNLADAKQICEAVIGQFGALRECEAYERVRDILKTCDKSTRR